jgi:hypothetical protein
VKKGTMLFALVLAFSTQLLQAQRSAPSSNIQFCPIEDPCDPDPTPTPLPPPPTPTPTPAEGLTVTTKYVVLSVAYAPPGSASTATYTNSTLFGASISLTSSFKNTVTETLTLEKEQFLPILGIFLGSADASTGFTQEADSSTSLAVMQTQAQAYVIRGPASSAVGLDHDEDIIWLWLNPAMNFHVPSSNVIDFDSVGFDDRFPGHDLEIFPVPVKYLKHPETMPLDVKAVLGRGWVCEESTDPACAPGGSLDPALQPSDYIQILKADPFTDPLYTIEFAPANPPLVSSCTQDGRYCLAVNNTFPYEPPPQGGQPITTTFTETRTAVATATAVSSVSVQNSVTIPFDIGSILFGDFLNTLKTANTLTITNQINQANNQQLSQTSAFSITGPTVADNYTGPAEINVFQDNVYGTFMFGAVPATTFDLSVSPTAQNVAQGGCASYSITIIGRISGFNSTVNLSVSGVPPGVTASFDLPSIAGAGVSHLQACASSSAALGSSTLTITGASGAESHSRTASLTVTSPFIVAATPASQSVVRGGTVSYTVTVTPQSGFNGTVTLSASGAPAGTTVSFSPSTITGQGSSTLTITTTAGTPLGLSTITILGISGSLSGNTSVSLNVASSSGPPPDFNLNASPGSQTVNAGDSASYGIVASPQNGFTGTVTLSASGPGGDIFVDISPSTITANGSAILTVTTSDTTAAGTYTVFVTGSSGSLNHSTTLTITVNSSCLDRGTCPLQ